jgi:Fe-S-cluster containining protein
MEINRLLNKARSSISKFCEEECKAYCCRKGYLVLNQKQIRLILKDKIDLFLKRGLLIKIDENTSSLYLGNYLYPCPCLIDLKCIIHKSKNRPDACKNFPIFLDRNLVKFSSRCLAVRQGLFYPYIKKLISLGYKIQESDVFYNIELHNFNGQ